MNTLNQILTTGLKEVDKNEQKILEKNEVSTRTLGFYNRYNNQSWIRSEILFEKMAN